MSFCKKIVDRVDRCRRDLGWWWQGLGKKKVAVYCWDDKANFGDCLTPYILASYGVVVKKVRRPADAEVVALGSVFELVPETFGGWVLGTGNLYEKTAKVFPQAKFLFVRGERTKANNGIDEDVAVGDFGLLVGRLGADFFSKKKTGLVGVVAHMDDVEDAALQKLKSLHGDKIEIIRADTRDVRGVLRRISACEVILSSSLHGLVVADALGIASGWVEFSRPVFSGVFKYDDYYSALGVSRSVRRLGGGEGIAELRSFAQPPAARLVGVVENLDCLVRGWIAEWH